MLVTFPAVLRPVSGGYAPMMKTLSGGQALSGYEQVVSSFSARWQASFVFPVRRPEQLLALRAFVIAMRGRSNSTLVPAFDCGRGPYLAASAPSPIGSNYSSGFYAQWPDLKDTAFEFTPIPDLAANVELRSLATVRMTVIGGTPATGMWLQMAGIKRRLSDLTQVAAGIYDASISPGFALTAGTRTAPAAFLTAPVALNATSVTMGFSHGAVPQPGQLFSLGSRFYEVESVDGINPYTVGIWPWAREAVAENTVVDFVHPACEMRFASDGEGADVLKSLQLLRFGTATLNFDEVAV